MDWSPPPEDISLLDTQPLSIPFTQKPRRVSRNPRRFSAILFLLSMGLIIIVSARFVVPALKARTVVPIPTPTRRVVTTPTPTPTPVFDPDVGAVLPTHRVV